MDGAIRQKTKFPMFSLLGGYVPISRSFVVMAKKEILKNESWLPWQYPLKNQKSWFWLIIYSHSGTEW